MATQIRISKTKLRSAIIFAILVLFFAAIFYIFWPFPVTQWNFGGKIFEFRSDLKKAVDVLTPVNDCKSIHETFNNFFVIDLTIYVHEESFVPDIAILEATELTQKLIAYYDVQPLRGNYIPRIFGSIWNESTDTTGTLDHLKIFIVTPPHAEKFGVEFVNGSVRIIGRNLFELDLATTKAMMCMFESNVTYGIFSKSPFESS